MTKIRVGSRDSRLAVIQAELVIKAIRELGSGIETELVTMKTTGDKILNRALYEIGGKGLFIKELDEALLSGAVDITVHSFKDMPMEPDERLPIVALSEREDPRDVLIYPKTGFDDTKPIGSSSKRRQVQLHELGFREVAPVRGNVGTRLSKLDSGGYGALVLAAAGVKRLGLKDRINRIFDAEELLPAACQGIIAVQARATEDTGFLRLFNSEASWQAAAAERAFVTALGGGCSSPIAAYATLEGGEIFLRGMYVNNSGGVLRGSIRCGVNEAESGGISLARKLMEEAGE